MAATLPRSRLQHTAHRTTAPLWRRRPQITPLWLFLFDSAPPRWLSAGKIHKSCGKSMFAWYEHGHIHAAQSQAVVQRGEDAVARLLTYQSRSSSAQLVSSVDSEPCGSSVGFEVSWSSGRLGCRTVNLSMRGLRRGYPL